MNATAVYTDLQGLARLRAEITADSGSGQIREVAGQFAAVFTHMMLKSMRDASLGEGIFDSDQSLFYRDLFDQQLALTLGDAGGVGIADLIARELSGTVTDVTATDVTATDVTATDVTATDGAAARRALAAYEHVRHLAAPAAAAAATQDREAAADTGSSRNTNWSGRESR